MGDQKTGTTNLSSEPWRLVPVTKVVSRRVLVVGGGIAALQAALDVAAGGLPVTLVEEGPAIGGIMAQLDKTFPTNDCAMCILSPRLLQIARHPLIDLLTLTSVLAVEGEPGEFRVLLHKRPRYVDISKCSACGECTRVCPQSILDPYNLGLAKTKAIHVPFPQAIPQAAYLSPEHCRLRRGKPCSACLKVCEPQAIDLSQTATQWVENVGAIILAPGARPAAVRQFPGYEHPDVVTSLEFERLLSSTGPHAGKLLKPSDRQPPERLAFIQCVGSRDPLHGVPYCSSLCCMASLKQALVAQEISEAPLKTTLFYMDVRAQGKGYERYLEEARVRGVELIPSRVTAVTTTPEGFLRLRYADSHGHPRERQFDMAVLAVGLRPPDWLPSWGRNLGVNLNEHGFIWSGALSPVCTSRPGIFVCGAGREPMDISEAVTMGSAAAAAASRLLAISQRLWRLPLPLPEAGAADSPCRIGVFLCHCGTNIAKTIDLQKLAAAVQSQPDVVHVESPRFACSVDATAHLAEAIKDHRLNRVVVAACTPRTHEPVFQEVLAGAGLNPGYLSFANIREQCSWVHQQEPEAALRKAISLVCMAVQRAKVLNPVRRRSFPVTPRALILGGGVAGMTAALTLADQGFHCFLVERQESLGGLTRRLHFTLEGDDPQAFLERLQESVYGHPNIEVLLRTEAVRLTGHVGNFQTTVRQREGGPEKVEDNLPRRQRSQEFQERHLEHGVILVATGARLYEPQGRFLYGEDPRVCTQLELESWLKNGAEELSKVRRLVMIQCVGSREPEHPYCSRLCCSEAIKNAMLLKERYPLMDITVLYRDVRAYGFREIYYRQAKEKGVVFIPFTPEHPPRVEIGWRRFLTVKVWDELLGQEVGLGVDLVVLSTGLAPAAGYEELARLLGLPLTLDGFFLEAHQKLRPVETAKEGIFLCGLAHYPKSLGETVAQAQAAAMRAAAVLFQTRLVSGDLFAEVMPGKCRRCLSCLAACPFVAITLGAGGRPEVQPEICQGCGICVADCPAFAIHLSRFSKEEIEAQIEEALNPSS